ncbi:MAG: PAS domain S-box protein, partial [Chloroflexota bacterium]
MNSPLNVLFVEDSADDAQLVMLQLEQEGLTANCRRVDSEAEFIAALDPPPDLILSDFAMPHFDGLHALRIVRERPLDIPFILISGKIGEELAVDAIKQGADDYIMKDRLGRLGSAVKSVLNQKRLRAEKARADLALRHGEERYRNIFQTVPVSIWEEDFTEVKTLLDNLRAQGVTDFRAHLKDHPELAEHAIQMVKVVDVNETTLRLYGAKDKAELLGDLEKFLAPDDFHEELIALAEGKTYMERETVGYTSHGEPLNLWLTQTFFTSEDGHYKALICINDITELKRAEYERKQMEEGLRLVEQEYRSIFENAPMGIFQSTPEGRFIKVNAAMAKTYGYDSPEEMVASIHNIGQQIYYDQASRQVFQRALADHGQVIDLEYKNWRKDGSIIWTSTNARVVRDAAGQVLYYEGFIRDITEKRETESRYQTLFEFAPIPLFIKDREGHYTGRNAENRKYWDWDWDESSVSFGLTDKDLTDADTAMKVREQDLRIIQTGQMEVFEQQVQTILGKRIFITQKTALRNASNQVIGV